MAIVTITTDLGNGSFSLASLKGAILAENPDGIQIMDIASDIKAYNIVDAAFALANAYPFFPEKSIHIIHVNPFYASQYKLIVLHHKGQYFIAPNHGFLPLLFDNDLPDQAAFIDDFTDTSSLYRCYANLVSKLFAGEPVSDSKMTIDQRIALKPVMSKDSIRGTVIYIDQFGNLVTNVKKEPFERIRNNRSFGVFFRHKDPITRIRDHYYQVPVGETLCRFNTAGLLEIAINLGNAHQSLEIQLDDIIQIDFYNP